ncbi:MAG: addiction module protein [Planctomycetales bacterium]
MPINSIELRALPAAEKLQIVEMLWDELGESDVSIPLPEWVAQEAVRRRDEMQTDPSVGLTHEEAWRRIEAGDG